MKTQLQNTKENDGWNFPTDHGIQIFHEDKKYAIESRNHFLTFTKKVGKLRYGRRRKIDSCYGFQKRYQVSTAGGMQKYDSIGDADLSFFEVITK